MSCQPGLRRRRISGAGGLFTVVFQAVGRGNTNVSVSSVSLTASTGQPIGANSAAAAGRQCEVKMARTKYGHARRECHAAG